MECLPGSALFLGGKRNRDDHNWCCDESDLELSKKHRRLHNYMDPKMFEGHLFENFKESALERQRWMLHRWLSEFGDEALEPKLFDACWEESDWNESLGEGFFEIMYRIHTKDLLTDPEYFLRPFYDEESIGLCTKPPLEKMPRCVPFLEKMPRGVPVLLEMAQRVRMLEDELEKRERCLSRQRKPLERRAHLRKALRNALRREKRERLDMARLSSMLRFIRNNRFTATASAEGIHIKIIDRHSIEYSAIYWRTDILYTHGALRSKLFKTTPMLMGGLMGCSAAVNAWRLSSIVDIVGVDPCDILLSRNNVSKSRDFRMSWHREGTYSSEDTIISWKNIVALALKVVRCRKTCRSFGIWDLARLDASCLIQAYLHARDVKCSVTTSVKGGTDIRIGRHTIHAPKYLSVRHPLLQMQMVLFSDKRCEDILSCTKSRAPRSIFNNMAKRLQSFVSPNVCDAGCISAKPNIESINTGTGFELNPRESIGKSDKPTENESPNAKGNDDHRSVYETELDNQFIHAVDGVHLPFRTTGAVVTHGPVLPETSLVPVSQLFAPDFRMSGLLRHGDRLDILETKEITEQIQVDQCSYNTRSCCIDLAFIPVVPMFVMRGIDKTTVFSFLLPAPKHMMSVRHPLIQMVLYARKRFEDMSCSINFMGPMNMFAMARRLCSFALANVYGAQWASAILKPESLYAGMGSESVLRENIGMSYKLTENEAQRHSAPDSRGAEHGVKAATTKITSASWVVATAAPHHATGNRDLLHGFVTEHDDQFVHAVDGVPMPVKARGAVVTDAVVLPDVWFVPGLKSNMVSVSQLAELGYSVGFGCGECCIRSAGDGKIVGKARLGKDGLYKLDFLKVSLAI